MNKMKKIGLLILSSSAAFALASCSLLPTNNQDDDFNDDDVGVITTEKNKANVIHLYEESVDNNEELEEIEETTGEDPVEDPTEEEETGEDTTEGSSEETGEDSNEETTDEPSEDIEDVISSYHVDYTYEYALKVSAYEQTFIDQNETESYSLTYQKVDDEVLLELNKNHQYKENAYYEGEENIHAVYQDDLLYVNSTIENGKWYSQSSKVAYSINSHRIYKEFGDFFRYVYQDLFVDGDSNEDAVSYLTELLNNESVSIDEVGEKEIAISYDEDGVKTSIVFDTEFQVIKSATFDRSQALLANMELGEDSPFTIDTLVDKTTIQYTYNQDSVNTLSDEEKEEYTMKKDHSHHNDHSYYNDEEKGKSHHSNDTWEKSTHK